MTSHEELVGGCCVCSDDQGFSNNALVYCDGKGCTVACHTACYGIVSIPEGDWYCRRCELGEFHAPCQLCPLTEGAMKRTSDGHWAHVICALYIPEVSFGNDKTMEPIILSKIPSMRYGQECSICIKKGCSKSDAIKGACCECTVKNCSELFHVTCAQQAGLLYEDVRKNNCQYPIYCETHRPKFSKFIRQVPPFQYYCIEKTLKTKEKEKLSKTSDSISTADIQTNQLSSLERQQISNNETSQSSSQVTSSNSFSPVVIELNREGHTSRSTSSLNQSIIDIGKSSTTISFISSNINNDQQTRTSIGVNNLAKDNLNSKIKIEANDIDYQIIDNMNHDRNIQLHKKSHHSNEDCRRPVGRPPSKKTHLSQSKTNNHTMSLQQHLKSVESPTKNDQNTTNSSSLPSINHPLTISIPVESSFPPQTLEEFLEQEWESTSDFFLQQNMPQDVSSLLSCLYQFKAENASLKKQFDELKHRRDSLRVINANLRRKLSETVSVSNTSVESSSLPVSNQKRRNRSKSSIDENPIKLNKIIPSEMEFLTNNVTAPSSFSYQSTHPYLMNKTESLPLAHGLSLELLSQVLTTNGPQLFAPTWNISNFGYASFPGANSISLSDESILHSYPSFQR